MLQWKKQYESAFTLIELLVVVIIVAILAAVGVPLLSANVQRSRASEAEAGLGTFRTGIRAFLAENGGTFPTGTTTVTLLQAGLLATDVSGRWFDSAAYSNTTGGAGTSTYCITANGANSTAFKAAQVQAPTLITRSMDQNGTIGDGVCNGVNVGGAALN